MLNILDYTPSFHGWVAVFVVISSLLKFQYILYSQKRKWKGNEYMSATDRCLFMSIADHLSLWYDYRLHGEENIDKVLQSGRSCLLLGHHSRCSFDLFVVFATIQPRLFASYLLFKLPGLAPILPLLGVSPSKDDQAFIDALSQSSQPVMLIPGGFHECMKSWKDLYQVTWKKEPGFARIIADQVKTCRAGQPWPPHTSGISVIPFATRNAESAFFNHPAWFDYSGRLVHEYYQRFQAGEWLLLPYMMTIILFSIGLVYFPVPFQMDTVLGEPIPFQPEIDIAESYGQRVVVALQTLIDETQRGNSYPARPVVQRRSWITSLFYYLFLFIYGLYIVIQNFFLINLLLVSIWSLYLALWIMTLLQKKKKTTAVANHDTKKGKNEQMKGMENQEENNKEWC